MLPLHTAARQQALLISGVEPGPVIKHHPRPCLTTVSPSVVNWEAQGYGALPPVMIMARHGAVPAVHSAGSAGLCTQRHAYTAGRFPPWGSSGSNACRPQAYRLPHDAPEGG
jgi:hypothetical protein